MRAAFLIVLAALGLVAGSPTRVGTVYVSGQPGQRSYEFKSGIVDKVKGAAWGKFEDSGNQTGWGVLTISTHATQEPFVQTYSAGMLEAHLTADLIHANYNNFMAIITDMTGPVSEQVWQWIDRQQDWVDDQVEKYRLDMERWTVLGAIQAQLTGLIEGYAQAAPSKPLSRRQLTFLTVMPDILDIISAVHPERRPQWNNMTKEEAEREFLKRSFCSALVKVTPENIFMTHATWMSYGLMLRMYKYYNFPLFASLPGKLIAISSYPGVLSSPDDFWMSSSGIVAMETSNNVFDASLYTLLQPDTLLAYQRVRLANVLAHNTTHWASLFAFKNSGTYNNQYMVMDYKRYRPGDKLQKGLFMVCEQIPGYVRCEDQTQRLSKDAHFASYNVPFYKDIWTKMGYEAMAKAHGDQYSWEKTSRGQIFRRDQGAITTMAGVKRTIRNNDYISDPLAGGNPFHTICSRGDLASPKVAQGCLDAKITDGIRIHTMTAEVISGPSYTTAPEFPPFAWTSEFAETPHEAQPEKFDFPFVNMSPVL